MKRGLALILVVGVLAVLAVLGSAFAVLSRLERKSATQRAHATRAWLLARSGIEDAQARLGRGQDPAYAGEDFNDDRVLGAGPETSAQVFQAGLLNRDECPVQHALRPSYFVRAPGGAPALRSVDGRLRAYSGQLRGDTQQWALKALPQGGFHINGGDPCYDPAEGYNPTLKRMLGVLAKAVDEEQGGINGLPVSQADGEALVMQRPRTSRGWESWAQVKALALGGSQVKLDALRPYLTLSAWVDKKVVRPNVVPWAEGWPWTSWGNFRKQAHQTPMGLASPDFEWSSQLLPRGRIAGRAPVSLEWARRRRPALIALLGGLKGLYMNEALARHDPPHVGGTEAVELSLTWVPGDDAHVLAGLLATTTSDLSTWQRFHDWCDSLASFSQSKRDLIKAGFNPNTGLNKLNPTKLQWKTLDKSDLLVYSTELSLQPLHDHEMESVGRILDAGGRVLASRTLKGALAGPSAVRLTAQTELVCGDLGRLDIAGDERSPRLPGSAPYLTLSQGMGMTWGRALLLPGRGLGLQTYPEPYVNPGMGLRISPAAYDGSLALATVETEANALYGVTATTADMKMLARFDDGFDLDVHDGAGFQCLLDAELVTAAQLGNSVFDPVRPSTLYPDGAYSELARAPAWPDLGNADGFHGVMSFWLKRGTPGLRPFVKWTNFGSSAPVASDNDLGSNHLFWLGWGGNHAIGILQNRWVWLYESGAGGSGEDNPAPYPPNTIEFLFLGQEPVLPLPMAAERVREWKLVTLYYNFRSATPDNTGEMLLNDGSVLAGRTVSANGYPIPGTAVPFSTDITRNDALGPHRLSLGTHSGLPQEGGDALGSYLNGADSTFDEIAIYDFGTVEASAASLAMSRFPEGRFYKESAYPASGGLNQAPGGLRCAGEWFSAPVNLGSARLLSLSWTVYVPKCLKPAPSFGYEGDPPPDGRVTLELAHAAVQVPAPAGGADYATDATGREIAALFTDPAGEGVQRRVDAPFRFHAVFQPNLSSVLALPILEPMVLDDITLSYQEVARSPFRAWGE